MRKFTSFTAPLVLLAASACAPSDNGSDDTGEGDEPQEEETASASIDEAVLVANTAWLSVGQDGSVQTTFLDQGGRYRDFRNGEPADTGTWEQRPDGAICFTPDEGQGGCWGAGALDADGSTYVTSADGKRVEIKRITYTAPPLDDETQEAS